MLAVIKLILWKHFLGKTTPELISGLGIVCNPKKAVRTRDSRLPRRIKLFPAHALSSCELVAHLRPLRCLHGPYGEVGRLEPR